MSAPSHARIDRATCLLATCTGNAAHVLPVWNCQRRFEFGAWADSVSCGCVQATAAFAVVAGIVAAVLVVTSRYDQATVDTATLLYQGAAIQTGSRDSVAGKPAGVGSCRAKG